MNPWYRVLTIEGKRYIFDMGGWSFWKVLFPFAYWIFPNTVYKINDDELIENIIVPEVKSKSTGRNVLLASVIGIVLANLLQPLVNYFDIEGTPFVNTIIVVLVFAIILAVFFYINISSKKNLMQMIDLNQYVRQRLWIRPQSAKHFSFILFSYLFLLAFIIFIGAALIHVAINTVIFLFWMIILSFLLFINLAAVGVGDTTVKFKMDK